MHDGHHVIKMVTSNDLHAGVSTVHLKLSHIVSTSSRLEFFIRKVLIRGAIESLQRQPYFSFDYRTVRERWVNLVSEYGISSTAMVIHDLIQRRGA
jgi:hypothetical protein